MRCLLLLPLGLFALPLAAQQASHACSGITEPAARLACYDEAFPPSQEVIAVAAEQARADFGLSKPRESLRNPGQTVQQAEPDRIEGRVTKVDHAHGGRRFHLENGQVWMQTEASSLGQVRPGDVVRLRKGLMGSYQLVTADGVVLRVRRTR